MTFPRIKTYAVAAALIAGLVAQPTFAQGSEEEIEREIIIAVPDTPRQEARLETPSTIGRIGRSHGLPTER